MRRDLVQRAMAHDHEAFSELARLSADRLYAVARLILHDQERAEDAAQETLVAAWRDIATLRDPDRFEAWIRRLLVRACYREARKERQRHRMEVRVEPLGLAIPDPSHDVADRDEIERGFRRLDPEQRALLVLRYHLGLELHETAEALGLPIGTVKSRLHRTTQALRATLDADARNGHQPIRRTA
jgi:RNA polymerase sigma-70 factor (ECF subfamily)